MIRYVVIFQGNIYSYYPTMEIALFYAPKGSTIFAERI